MFLLALVTLMASSCSTSRVVLPVGDTETREAESPQGTRKCRAYEHYEDHHAAIDVSDLRIVFPSDASEHAFKASCRRWMQGQRQDLQLGNLTTPRRTAEGEWRAECFCMDCADCYAGNGTVHQFRAKPDKPDKSMVVHAALTVMVSGTCSGKPRQLKSDAQGDDPSTRLTRRHVMKAVQALAQDKESVTPTKVARKLAAQGNGELRVNPCSLRYLTRTCRKKAGVEKGQDPR